MIWVLVWVALGAAGFVMADVATELWKDRILLNRGVGSDYGQGLREAAGFVVMGPLALAYGVMTLAHEVKRRHK